MNTRTFPRIVTRLGTSLALMSALLAPAAVARGGSTWDGGGGASTGWSVAANWDADTLPLFNGTEVLVINPGTTNRILTLDAANRSASRLDFGNSSNTGGQDAVINSPGQTITLTHTASSTASPLVLLRSGDNAGAIFENGFILDGGAPGSYTAHFRQQNNAGFGNQFNGAIVQAAGQNWTVEVTQASARGTVQLNNSGNVVTAWRTTSSTLNAGANGALGAANVLLNGGTLGFNQVDHFVMPVANSITFQNNTTINASTPVRLTGSFDQNSRTLTVFGGTDGLLRLEGAQVGAPTGTTSVQRAALAVSNMNRLAGGTLELGGTDANTPNLGVFILGSGDVPTPADFAANRSGGYNQAGGANTWRVQNATGSITGGGFAARNSDVVIPAGFAGLTSSSLDKNISLGSAARVAGQFYASNAVDLQQPITYTGTQRTISVGGQALQTGDTWTLNGPVNEISGALTGPGAGNFVLVLHSGGRLGSNGDTGGSGIVRISNTANSFSATSSIVIGSRRTSVTLPSGRTFTGGNSYDQGGGVVIFSDDAAFGGANEVVVIGGGSSGANNGGLLLFENQGGGIKTFARNFTIMNNNASSRSGFGSFQGDVRYTGTATLNNEGGDDELIHVQNGTLRLGQAGGPAATITNNRPAASFEFAKGGAGTLALENLAIGGSNSAVRVWRVFDGALRETGNTATDSVLSGRILLNGGVLEGNDATAARPSITLGTASAGQLAWVTNQFGGFAAFGGTFTIDIGPAGVHTQQFTGNFANGSGGLLFGSQTADSLVNFIDNLDLQSTTRVFRVLDNPNSAGDVARLSGIVSGTGGLTKTGDGILELTGNNTYSGITSVNAGVLRIDAENRLGANPGVFNPAQLSLNGGTLHTTATFDINDANRGLTLGAAGGTFNVEAGTTLTLAAPNNVVTGPGGLTKEGTGRLVLAAANTYAGTTNVNAGVLQLAGSVIGDVNVNNTGFLIGTGPIGGALVVNNGGSFSPGNSPGTMSVGSAVWNGGGTFVFEINDFLGTAGADPGWDLLDVGGTLQVIATAGTPFIIDITSQDAPANTAGPADNFNAALDYDLLIADTNLVTGFDPSFFDLQTANFQNNLLGGMFGIELRTNNQIFLTFRAFDAGGGGPSMPVPEPASVVVWSLAGMALAAWARRRRR